MHEARNAPLLIAVGLAIGFTGVILMMVRAPLLVHGLGALVSSGGLLLTWYGHRLREKKYDLDKEDR